MLFRPGIFPYEIAAGVYILMFVFDTLVILLTGASDVLTNPPVCEYGPGLPLAFVGNGLPSREAVNLVKGVFRGTVSLAGRSKSGPRLTSIVSRVFTRRVFS